MGPNSGSSPDSGHPFQGHGMSRTYHHIMPKLKWKRHCDDNIPYFILEHVKHSSWYEYYTREHRKSPKWWDKIKHTRPKRHWSTYISNEIVKGRICPNAALYPLGNNKPHNYYD